MRLTTTTRALKSWMEQNDTLKLGLDPDGLSKRRISSILKAPRTSMKACGVDQDDNQESRPTEKRRNSRRVSFATTNNVHVFSKDTKTEPPVLSPIHNSTVAGLDAALDTPLHVSLIKKGNFFPDPVLLDDCVDKTVLLGDDTGCMDMTHSHTITINNKEVEINPQFCSSIGRNDTEHHNLKGQTDIPSKTTAAMRKDAVDCDFNDFLASISKKSVTESFKKKSLDLFGLKDTSELETDKENVLPSVFNKQVCCPVNSQPKGLKSKHSTFTFLEEDHMDMTRSHTVVIDRQDTAQYAPYLVHENHGKCMGSVTQLFSNDSDNMELTQSQTTNLNTKPMENVSLNISTSVDQNEASFVSDDTSGMVMTEVFDEYVQEHENQATKEKVVFLFPHVNRISSINQSKNGHVSDQNTVDCLQSNLSFAPKNTFDDIEITPPQTAVLEIKCGKDSFCKTGNVSSVVPTFSSSDGDRIGGLVDTEPGMSKRAAIDTVLHNDQSDFMELTCQANTATVLMSPSPDDMELTTCNNIAINSQSILATSEKKSRKRASFMLPPSVSSEVRQVGHFQSDLSVAHMLDDMEMTQCQTAVLETKCCAEYQPFSKTRKSVSLASMSYKTDAIDNKTMDITHELGGNKSLNRFSSSERRKSESSVEPTAQKSLDQDLPDCIEMHQGRASFMLITDMELTGCQSVPIDTKSAWQSSASNAAQNPPYLLTSRSTVLNTCQMEKSKVVSDEPGKVLPTPSIDCRSPVAAVVVDAGNPVGNRKEEMSCLVDTDYKNCDASHLSNVLGSQSLNLTAKNLENSEEHCDMELTKAFTMPFEDQCSVAFNQREITKESAGNLSGVTDHKAFKDWDCAFKDTRTVTAIKTNFEVESEVDAVKKECDGSVQLRRRSLADLQVELKKIAQCVNEPNGLVKGSATAPIATFIGSERCIADGHSERDSCTEPPKETPNVKNKVNSSHNECLTPFNLKNALAARLSIGGIMPKLPLRAKSASPHHLEPKHTKNVQNLHLETHLDVGMQSNSHITDFIDNTVLPEDGFSDTLVSCLSNRKDEQEASAVVLLDDSCVQGFESDVTINQCEKTPCEVGDMDVRKEASEKLQHSDSTAPSLIAKMIDDTCSSSSSTNVKCEGISESTLRNSQLDSQIDGSVDHEFDFNKKLEDGSITVNEFLSHFGANFVIHKSRPSALPDGFRAAETHTMLDFLREKYIHRPKQRVYETDCQKLTEMAEGLKSRMAEQDKPLRNINGSLLQDVCGFSKFELQKFGARLKEQRVYFRKKSKILSHGMKRELYSELLKTTQEAKLKLMAKINEVNEMFKDLDGCASDLESELAAMNGIIMRDQQSVIGTEPSLKEKQEDLDALNSVVAETEKQIDDLECQKVSLENTQKKLQYETRGLKSHITNLNSLNEWRFSGSDENGAIFTFLHDTVQLEVKLKKASEKEWVREDNEKDMDISFTFLLNGERSQSHASMIHKLLASYIQAQSKWMQKYPTTRHIPMLLHDVGLVVSRLRLLGEEIHQLKKWGGLRLGILHINCVNTLVEITFSSVKAFVKFELSLAMSSDYPFGSIQVGKFQNHTGNTRVDQIEGIVHSVVPAKNYLTKVIKRIHAELLG
ncbi:uncharacterized protein knl1 isoform X3 [Electrophorus electricus]|uniref:uncharacterized protein knl1 isoform X3 n=1 Tax=Electrophorus electricus TaxID=8005 RepID=UPI0015CFC82B|nr:uncharacterized protein knl1 isoform X3 [Electrophorus electricus]